jgi:hypothetical protein
MQPTKLGTICLFYDFTRKKVRKGDTRKKKNPALGRVLEGERHNP